MRYPIQSAVYKIVPETERSRLSSPNHGRLQRGQLPPLTRTARQQSVRILRDKGWTTIRCNFNLYSLLISVVSAKGGGGERVSCFLKTMSGTYGPNTPELLNNAACGAALRACQRLLLQQGGKTTRAAHSAQREFANLDLHNYWFQLFSLRSSRQTNQSDRRIIRRMTRLKV